MKQVISTTGETILFRIRGTEPLHIDCENGVDVTDLDANLIVERLGSQVRVVDTTDAVPTSTDVPETEEAVNNLSPEMITPEMRAAGIDETTPLMTREEVVAELGEEKVAQIEAEALETTPETEEVVIPETPVEEVTAPVEETIPSEEVTPSEETTPETEEVSTN